MKSSLILVIFIATSSFVAAQGSLTPPAGQPAPVMKTLDQIEARTPLVKSAADTTAVQTSDASFHFVILKSGSYYLTGNLSATKVHGIRIAAPNVTLDLGGFSITGLPRPGGVSGNGIQVESTGSGFSLRNGSIEKMSTGVLIDEDAKGSSCRDLSVQSCSVDGILGGSGASFERCLVRECGSGIVAGSNSSLRNCSVDSCTGTGGIYAGIDSTLVECSVKKCVFSGGTSHGILLTQGCLARECTVSDCTASAGFLSSGNCLIERCMVRGCIATVGIDGGHGGLVKGCEVFDVSNSLNSSIGIKVSFGGLVESCLARGVNSPSAPPGNSAGIGISATNSTVRNCTSSSNRGAGIEALGSCLIIGNLCVKNAAWGDAAGIIVKNEDNRIDGNQVTGNTRGIEVTGSGNLIIGNTASDNTTNFQIATANKVGFIVAAPNSGVISGSTGGAGVGTNNPWDNISF